MRYGTLLMYTGITSDISDRMVSEFNEDLGKVSIGAFADKLREWSNNERKLSTVGISEEEYIETELPYSDGMDYYWGIQSDCDLNWYRNKYDYATQFRPMKAKLVSVVGQTDKLILADFITYLIEKKGYSYRDLYYKLWCNTNEMKDDYKNFELQRKGMVN